MKTLAAGPLRGTLQVPGDKSISHRALILGALSRAGLKVRGLCDGQDAASTRRCLEALGARFRQEPDGLSVLGGPWRRPAQDLDCGNSGTTMRLLAGALAGQPFESRLTGDASLSRRPMGRVAEPLQAMGASLGLTRGCAPMTVRGRRPLKAVPFRLPVPSAQVKSAVMLAGLFADGPLVVEDPFGTRDHTERLLGWLSEGRAVRQEGPRIEVVPGLWEGGKAMTVPGDISSAAFFLGGAVLVPGSQVTVTGVGLNPTRLGFLEALQEMGAAVSMSHLRTEAGEPLGDVTASTSSLRGLRLGADRVPALVDEVPLLAVLAASASGESRLEGLGELRLKESDRLAGVAAGLLALGAGVEVQGDSLIIAGSSRFRGAALKTWGDHRLAMAFAVAAAAAEGDSSIDDESCAAISYPGFFAAWEALQARGRRSDP